MKIILAFDSFKGCISAGQACDAAYRAIRRRLPDATVVRLPMSDGGEGLVSCVSRFREVRMVTMRAHGPLMDELDATYAMSPDGKTAYMEMAATSGLTLVPEARRNPLLTTTYGVGEMVVDAARRGVRHIMMGIGGSATNDGGAGMIEAIEASGLKQSELPSMTVACDVDNPLCGPRGASAVFGPQKGATPEMVTVLDRRLEAFANDLISRGMATREMMNTPGSGAAGGLGFGLMAYLKAELKPGIDLLLDMAGIDAELQDADLVITGEGRSDAQTLMGKVPHGILKRASRAGVPVYLLSGSIDDPEGVLGGSGSGARCSNSFQLVRSINEGDTRPLEELLSPEVAFENLSRSVSSLF